MRSIPIDENDPRIQAALSELEEMIQRRWPAASFITEHGFDPEGIYLIATVDVEDTVEVMEALVGRLVDFQVEEDLPVYVNVVRPQKFQTQHA